MINSTTALEANLDYAERMVRKGYGTPEQAVQICGVKMEDLMARLSEPPQPEGAPKPNWRRFLS